MATYNVHNIPGLTAGADLSSSQYLFAVVNGANQAIVNTSAGGIVDGVIQDHPGASGLAVSVADWGVSKVVAGAAVAAGALVMSDATGKGITATATNYARGRALTAASASGEIIEVLLFGPVYVAA